MAKSDLIGETYGRLSNSLTNMSGSFVNEGKRQIRETQQLEADKENEEKARQAEDSRFVSDKYNLEATYKKYLKTAMQSLPSSIDVKSYDQRMKDLNATFVSDVRASGIYDERSLAWLESEFLPQQNAETEKAIAGVKNFVLYNWLASRASMQADVYAADKSKSVDEATAAYAEYYSQVGLGNIPNGGTDYGIFTPDEFREAIRGTKALQAFQNIASDVESGYLFSPDFNMAAAMRRAKAEAGYNPNLLDDATFQGECNQVLAGIESAVKGEVKKLCDHVRGRYNEIKTSPGFQTTGIDLTNEYAAAKNYPPQLLGEFVDITAEIEGHNAEVQYNAAIDSVARGEVTDTVLAMLDAGYASTHAEKFVKAREGAVTNKILEEARLKGNNDPSQVMTNIYNGQFSITVTDEDRYRAASEFYKSLKGAYDTISGYSDLVTKVNADVLAGSPVPEMLSALYDVNVTYTTTNEKGETEVHTSKENLMDVTEDKYPGNARFSFSVKPEFQIQESQGTLPLAAKKIFDNPTPKDKKTETTQSKAAELGLESGRGNIDFNTEFPQVKNDDGSVSTIETISINEDGNEVIIPTVWDGEKHTEEESIQRYKETGLNFGSFDTVQEATDYAEKLHELEAWKVNNNKESEPAHKEPLPMVQTTVADESIDASIPETFTNGVFTASAYAKNAQQQAAAVSGEADRDDPAAVRELQSMVDRGAPQPILDSMSKYYFNNGLLTRKTINNIAKQDSWNDSPQWDLMNQRVDDIFKDLDVSSSTISDVRNRVISQVTEAFRYSGLQWNEFEKNLTKMIDMLASEEMMAESMSQLELFNKVSQDANSYCETMTANGMYGQLFSDYANGKFDGIVNYDFIQKVQDENIVGNNAIRDRLAKLMNHDSYETAVKTDPSGMTKLMIETMTAIVNMHNEAGEFYKHVSERLNEYGISATLLDYTFDKDLGYVFVDNNSAKRGFALCIDPELMFYDTDSGISAQWKCVPVSRGSDGRYKIDRSKNAIDIGDYATVGANLFLATEKKPSEKRMNMEEEGARQIEQAEETYRNVYGGGNQVAETLGGWFKITFGKKTTATYKKQSANEEQTFTEAYRTAFGLWED